MEAILFDIGNVLLFFDHGRACRRVAGLCGLSEAEVRTRMFGSGAVLDYEEGRLTTPAFVAATRDLLGVEVSDDQFHDIWCDIFWENERVVPMVAGLAARYRLVLLSNTNAMHMEFIRQRFGVFEQFHGAALSYEVGHCKPSRAIFESALAQAGVAAEECLYIDDIAEYCGAGRQLGFQAIHYTPTTDLSVELAGVCGSR